MNQKLNIDNGKQNSLSGTPNIVIAGDKNNINGKGNVVDGSCNTISGISCFI
jgi:hypothetical protein